MRRDKKSLFFYLIIFVFFGIFFIRIHPLIVYDGDDWTYIAYSRYFLPSLRQYNPAKIFPETIQPLLGYLSVYLLYPITNDYIGSISIMYGLVLSLIITVYIIEFNKLISRIYPTLDESSKCIFVCLYIIIHFVIFKTADSGNKHLFYDGDLNTIYNYTVPNLINSILALVLIRNSFEVNGNEIKKTGMLFLGYICIFSNLFMTGIIMSCIGADLLVFFIEGIKKQITVKEMLSKRWYSSVLLFLWAVMAFFEANGQRAKQIGKKINLFESITKLSEVMRGINKLVFMIFIISAVAFAVSIFMNKRKKEYKETSKDISHIFTILVGSFLIETIFTVLIVAKTGTSYFDKTSVVFGILFYANLLIFFAIAYMLTYYKKTIIAYTFITTILLFVCFHGEGIYKNSIYGGISAQSAKKVDNDILDQILDAYENGYTKVEVKVPKGKDENNWPHAEFIGERISNTLLKHGLVDRKMDIKIRIDPTMNKKYGLEY